MKDLKLSWNENHEDELNETQKFWDLRAEEFYKHSQNDDELGLIPYLQHKGLINKSYNVLDIGCGPGKYILNMANKVRQVHGIDISPEMIKCAEKNVREKNLTNVKLNVYSWQEIDINKEGLENEFDFVFASMTPAVNSEELLIKMVKASRKYCFMSGFVYRKDSIKDELFKNIIGDNEIKDNYKMCKAFNTLWNIGMYPKRVYKDVEWTKEFSVEKAIKMYTIELNKYAQDSNIVRKKVKDYIEKISTNGIVKEAIKAKIAWITWKVC